MAERQTIAQKIHDLFAYRRIPELLRLGGIEKDSPFVERLYHLQEKIYDLDAFLEANWKIRKKDLKPYWHEIRQSLTGFSIPRKDHAKLLQDIRKYEAYELDLRKKKVPVGKSFEALYACKSCDVKLIRTLIYKHAPDLKEVLREKEWIWYDLITEVNDDIHDVFEDCETWNGNRFLLSMLIHGKSKTRRTYKDFLDRTGKSARKHFKKKKDPARKQMLQWTIERMKETEDLLRETMDGQKLDLVKKSKIAGKIDS